MDLLISAGVVMVWIAVAMIMYMTYLGFDVRSRGFTAGGPAFLTLSKLEITIREYYRKRAEHPVADAALAGRAKFYFILFIVSVVIVIALVVTVSLI